GLVSLHLPPASSASHTQDLDFDFMTRRPATKRIEPPIEWSLPTRIDYAVRPDVTLPSEPALVLADAGMPFIINNPSSRNRSMSLHWQTRTLQLTLKPREKKRLSLQIDAPAGLHPVTIQLDAGGEKTEIPVSILRAAPHETVVYPFDF